MVVRVGFISAVIWRCCPGVLEVKKEVFSHSLCEVEERNNPAHDHMQRLLSAEKHSLCVKELKRLG